MQRFHIQGLAPAENLQIIDETIIHQCCKVLRLKSQDFICVFDGVSYVDYIYKISNISKNKIELTKVETIKKAAAKINLSIFQALPNKLSKLEYIVQKNTEIGAHKIVVFMAQFSQNIVILTDKKINRLKKIAIEACEQSNNNIIPIIEIVKTPNFDTLQEGKNIILHSSDSNASSINDITIEIDVSRVNIFVGPEGGFSDEEVQNYLKHHFIQLYLGESILRTETAGVVVGFYFLQKLQ